MGHDHEGQRVSRRSLFAGLSAVGLGTLLASCGEDSTVTTSTGETISPQASTTADLTGLFAGASTCSLTATTTQGPYYFDADKIRSDIREDKQGKQLRVAIKVQDSETCAPLPNAVVEIWHCDAGGLYSGAESLSTGGGGGAGGGTPPSGAPGGGPGGGTPPSGAPGGGGTPPSGAPGGGGGGTDLSAADLTPTDDKRYLRGAQVTNGDGIVQFTTIWPGWYRGRTVHIHAMVHVSNNRVLTTQMMFDEALNTKVFASQPYAARTGRDTFNDGDTIYQSSMLMKVTEESDGYLGVIVFAADADRDGA
jgi:protocatechuate 3,4-dioxygenase beta subunit